jgi:hypothetical protein
VFTQRRGAEESKAILDGMAALATSQDAHSRVVIALRSDFYSTCAHYPWLADRISENQILVGPMRRHELRRAIEGFHGAGGVGGAIAQSAENAYEQLDEPERVAAR